MNRSKKMTVRLFTLVVICVGLADGLGAKIFSNYYNEVFHITAVQRGFLEIPRESPGILCMLLVAALSSLGNIWMGMIAQLLSMIGLVVMGCMSPTYGVMLCFLFVQSLGSHFFMPLNDAIAMDLAVSAHCAEVKGFKSEVAGDADIFIVPNIEAGNIMGKTLGDILGAKAAGVIVGTDTPIVMCSRADNDETKLCSIALGCLMAGLNK